MSRRRNSVGRPRKRTLSLDQKQNQSEKVFPSMTPAELFASIRERRRRSEQQSGEEGALLRRRLQELRGVHELPPERRNATIDSNGEAN